MITKVISSSDANILPGRTFVSKTADVSLTGLRIRLNHEPEIGSALEVWIVSQFHEGTIVLAGTVRWARPVTQEGFTHQAGLELIEQATPDFHRWQHVVADLLPHAPRPPAS